MSKTSKTSKDKSGVTDVLEAIGARTGHPALLVQVWKNWGPMGIAALVVIYFGARQSDQQAEFTEMHRGLIEEISLSRESRENFDSQILELMERDDAD